MASYNRVILIGNLTRDIELRYTPGGMAITENCVAVNDRRKNATGDWIEEATFVDVTLFGRIAEVCSEYLSKGSPIMVEGRLKLDQWEKDGQKRSKLYVIGERMQLIGGREGGGSGGSGGGKGRPQRVAEPSADEEYSAPSGHNASSGHDTSSGHSAPPGRREAQPTGDSGGGGYDDPDIPF